MTTAIVWFRNDLRLADNPALFHACANHDAVVPVFVDDAEHLAQTCGEASRVWLHHSLISLGEDLAARGSRLLLFRGEAQQAIERVIEKTGAEAVYWNRCYEPETIRRDGRIKQALKQTGLAVESFNAALLYEPWDLLKQNGEPFRVYTPFYNHLHARGLYNEEPLDEPDGIPAPKRWPASATLRQLELLPSPSWHKRMMQHWRVGEAAAHERLQRFLERDIRNYVDKRDRPGSQGTSRLSPHLHFGEISPRQVLWQVNAASASGGQQKGEATFIKEVVWREFSYHTLYHFPHTIDKPMNERFASFPWRRSKKNLQAWRQGRTGIPVVDAGMRELWHTGWMHNRVRMIVASFLTKNLMLHWREGECWFRDTLVDADIASNVFGWQWTAGSGADAAPYFRIFNPVLQGEKFDGKGDYVRRWLPELEACPDRYIHKPWEAPAEIRDTLDYPEPIVDLKATRERALEAFNKIRKNA